MLANTFKSAPLIELLDILKKEKIPFSFGWKSFLILKDKQKELKTEEVRLALWHEDFFKLSNNFPNSFILPENNDEKNLSPYYVSGGIKIFLDIIVGTDKELYKSWYKFKKYKRILYWGNGRKSLFYRLIGKNTEPILLSELVSSLSQKRYTRFIVLGSNINDFRIFLNLNYNNCLTVDLNGIKIPMFKEFENLALNNNKKLN